MLKAEIHSVPNVLDPVSSKDPSCDHLYGKNALLTKSVQSRWLNISLLLFFRFYFEINSELISRAGKESHLCLQHNKPTSIVSDFFVLLFATPLPALPKNYELYKSAPSNFFVARDQSGQSLVDEIRPQCPLGQPIRTRDSFNIAHGRCQRYNNNPFRHSLLRSALGASCTAVIPPLNEFAMNQTFTIDEKQWVVFLP